MLAILKTAIILGLSYGLFHVIMKKLHKKLPIFARKNLFFGKSEIGENWSLDDLPLPELPEGVYTLPKGVPDPSLRRKREPLLDF
jgi:hypothetical protein